MKFTSATVFILAINVAYAAFIFITAKVPERDNKIMAFKSSFHFFKSHKRQRIYDCAFRESI